MVDVLPVTWARRRFAKYDLEAWMTCARGGGWGEITSTSNCTDYQARRLGVRFRDSDGDKTRFCHMLNGTVALSRAPIANSREPPAGGRVDLDPHGAATLWGSTGSDRGELGALEPAHGVLEHGPRGARCSRLAPARHVEESASPGVQRGFARDQRRTVSHVVRSHRSRRRGPAPRRWAARAAARECRWLGQQLGSARIDRLSPPST